MTSAKFIINNKKEIEYLSNLYRDISGRLAFCNGRTIIIDWIENPFFLLLDHPKVLECPEQLQYKGWIDISFTGPYTAKEVALEVIKIDQHNNESIKMWADFIDNMVESELKRTNDIGINFSAPKEKLKSTDELLLAIKLSKYVTHIIQYKTGYLLANDKSKYLTQIMLNDNYGFSTSVSFNNERKFCSLFMTNIDYINETFALWKENNYENPIENYYQ